MLLQKGANSKVTDTILNSSLGVQAKIVKESLRDDQQIELTEFTGRFYPQQKDLNLEKVTLEVPAPLKTFLDMIYSKSRTYTGQKNKEFQKIAIADTLMQLESRLLVDVFHLVGCSVSYSKGLKFKKCAALSSVTFDDFASDIGLESQNRSWQFIADTFDLKEDTTLGFNTTHATGIILSEIPKSEFIMFQPIKKEDIFSANLLEAARFNDYIKMYSKPNKSKFKQLILQRKPNSNIEFIIYQKLDLY